MKESEGLTKKINFSHTLCNVLEIVILSRFACCTLISIKKDFDDDRVNLKITSDRDRDKIGSESEDLRL